MPVFELRMVAKTTDKKILRSNSLNGSSVYNLTTINALKQKRNSGEKLSSNQQKALNIFEVYRDQVLSEAESEEDYEQKFKEMNTLANLTSFEEFLKEKYLVNK